MTGFIADFFRGTLFTNNNQINLTDVKPSIVKPFGKKNGGKDEIDEYTTDQPDEKSYTEKLDIFGKMYRSNSIIRHCVDLKTSHASDLEPQLTLKVIDKAIEGKKTLLKPFIKEIRSLLNNPNYGTTSRELARLTYTDLQVFGNSYWQKIRHNGKIIGLKHINIYKIEPKIYYDKNGRSHVVYVETTNTTTNTKNNKRRIYNTDNIIHFKVPNILNDLYGLSHLYSLYRSYHMDNKVEVFQQNYFKHGCQHGLIINVKNASSTDTIEDLKKQWREHHGGGNKPRDVTFLRDGDFEILSHGLQNLKDLDLRDLKNAVRQQICEDLGVHDYIRGVKQIDKQEHPINLFRTHHVFPLQRIVTETLTRDLLSKEMFIRTGIENDNMMYIDNGVRVKKGEMITIDYLRKLAEITPLTINEVRTAAGLPDMGPEGDIPVIWTPNGIVFYTQQLVKIDDTTSGNKEMELQKQQNNIKSDNTSDNDNTFLEPDKEEQQEVIGLSQEEIHDILDVDKAELDNLFFSDTKSKEILQKID